MSKFPEHNLWLEFQHSNIVTPLDEIDYNEVVDKIFCDIKYQATDEDFEAKGEPVLIGYMILNYYNIGLALQCGLSTFWAIDEESDISWALVDKELDTIKPEIVKQVGPTFNLNILEGELFVMNPEYRNMGLGEEALKGLVTHFKTRVGYFAFKSFPLQKERVGTMRRPENFREEYKLDELEPDFRAAQKKLNAFYRRCGFKMIRKSPNHFIMNMDPNIFWV